jgi:hypothetical protein
MYKLPTGMTVGRTSVLTADTADQRILGIITSAEQGWRLFCPLVDTFCHYYEYTPYIYGRQCNDTT